MIINSISFLNIDSLYKGICEKFKNNKFRNTMFDRNMPQLYNHIALTFDISEITLYEYIYLKMYATSISPYKEFKYDINYIKANFKNFDGDEARIDSIISFLLNAGNDANTNYDYSRHLLPAGFITTDCAVTFSGNQLCSIIGLNPFSFFVKNTNGECMINQDPESPDYGMNEDLIFNGKLPELLSDNTIELFIHNFYKFMIDKANYKDIASDYINFSMALSKSSDNDSRLLNIRNPYFVLDISSDDQNHILETLNLYKENKMNTPDFTLEHTKLEFSIDSSFDVFTELLNILPYSMISSMQSLAVPSFNSKNYDYIPECPKELIPNFGNRYSGRLDALVNGINNMYNGHEKTDVIPCLELTSNYIKYKYTLLLSFNDINDYLVPYTKIDSKDYTVKLTKDIVEKIISMSSSFYNAM